jgi:hypothetical protein
MIKTNMVIFTGMLISIIGILSALALPSLGSLAIAQIGANVGNNNYSFGNSNINTNTTGSSLQNVPGMDFGGMNFSRLFEGTSFLGTIGVSMVNGVKVTGLNLPTDNHVSVTLKNTNASDGGNMTSAVTVIAIRAAMSSKDIMSLMAASNNQNGANASNMMTMMSSMNMMKSMQGSEGGTSSGNSNSSNSNSLGNSLANANATLPGSNFNPMSFLENLQMGSTSLVNPNWKLPQTITMGLLGNPLSSGSPSSAALPPAAEFIIAVVIPYTGQANLTTP